MKKLTTLAELEPGDRFHAVLGQHKHPSSALMTKGNHFCISAGLKVCSIVFTDGHESYMSGNQRVVMPC